MDVWSIGFLAGVMFGAIFLGIGVVAGRVSKDDDRDNQGQSGDDSDINIYVPYRDRDRSGNHGRNKPYTTEEKIMVLNTMRTGSSDYEKNIIDEIAHDLQERRDNEQSNSDW